MKSLRAQLAVYVVIATCAALPALLTPGSMAGDGVDAWGTYWFYWWVRTCVENFGDPSTTVLFFWPIGKDILAHTGNNFVDAVFSVPFQWVFGPTLYFPVFMIAVQLANAFAFRPLAREVLGEERVFGASLLWMINPYLTFEITAGRPTQAFACFLPIAVYLFLRVCRGGTWREAVFLGISVALTGWTYWFSAYFLVFLLLCLAAFEVRSWAAVSRLGAGAAVSAAIVAPGVWLMSRAWSEGLVPGQDKVAGSIFSLPDTIANNVSNELHGLMLAEFQGAPMLTQLAWALPLAVAAWKVRWGRWWLALVVVCVLAVGPALHVGDDVVVLPWYMALYRYLPFFNRLWFPYRLVSVAFIPAVLLVGALLPAGRRGLGVLGALVIAGLGGQAWYGVWPFPTKDVRPPQVLMEIAKEEPAAVIFVPMRIQHECLLWQPFFRLPMFGGMGESAPAMWPKGWRSTMDNPFIRALRAGAMGSRRSEPLPPGAQTEIRKLGFRWVVLRRDLAEGEMLRVGKTPDLLSVYARLTDVIGHEPQAVDHALVVWDLDNTWTPAEPFVATRERVEAVDWAPPAPPAWGAGLAKRGRFGQAPNTEPTTPEKPRVVEPRQH